MRAALVLGRRGSRATHTPLPAGFERSRSGGTGTPELRVFLTWLRSGRPVRGAVLKLGRVGTRSRPALGLSSAALLPFTGFMRNQDDQPLSSTRLLEDAA